MILSSEKKVRAFLALSGTDIELNGDKPGDIQVNNEDFYKKVAQKGPLA